MDAVFLKCENVSILVALIQIHISCPHKIRSLKKKVIMKAGAG